MKRKSKAEECTQLCVECMDVCEDTLVNHCLVEGGPHVEKEHVTLMLDCIEICRTSADFMRRQSSLHYLTCHACAEVCEACAESCDRLGDRQMQHCAKICRKCADACREMSEYRQAA